jgi:hypothetical protein
VVADDPGWSQETIHDGDRAVTRLTLPRGNWFLSIQYDASRDLHLESGSGTVAELPANLDFRGPGPYWPAGEIETTAPRTRVDITASVDDPPLSGRLMGASSVAHLGPIAASPAGPGYVRDGQRPLPGGGELLGSGAEACGGYVDWFGGR